jgi:hypothetical protein
MAIPVNAFAQGAVIFVVDALGSSYLTSHTATYMSGAAIKPLDLKSFDRADARYQLKVPVPATEFGHAVIVTGYSNASKQTVAYYHSSIFDVLKDDGYLAFGIMENGDTPEMIHELDAIVHNKNESIFSPDFEFEENSHAVPTDIERMMSEYPLTLPASKGKDPYSPYISYNAWGLDFTKDFVDYMNKHHPGQNYVLIVNIGGLDSAGHNLGFGGYHAVLSGMDGGMESLIDSCKRSNTILIVTGDHGMSFKNETSRGAHQSQDVAYRNESLLTPLFIYSNMTVSSGGIYGQECLAPTFLSLLDEPNTMSMGDGEPLPVKERPTLYLRSKEKVNVTVTSVNFSTTASFTGIYGIKGLEKGVYTVRYNGEETTIRLDHDELVDLREDERSAPAVPPWMVYLAVAGISVAGIGIALTLAWMRR